MPYTGAEYVPVVGQEARQCKLRKRRLPWWLLEEIIEREAEIEALRKAIEIRKCYHNPLGKARYKGIGEWGTI